MNVFKCVQKGVGWRKEEGTRGRGAEDLGKNETDRKKKGRGKERVEDGS